ncbi:phosphatidate cytidylyltransferase [bacterium SCSIO 12741]|nr:phosphatidate cytidylyltransferase [bacterium SCSIO 12741]
MFGNSLLQYALSQPIWGVMGGVFALLTTCSLSFNLLKEKMNRSLQHELVRRTRSWWVMAAVFSIALWIHPALTFTSVAFLSFVSLREYISHSGMKIADRGLMAVCYLLIPVHYGLIYFGFEMAGYLFLPLAGFLLFPVGLVLQPGAKSSLENVQKLYWGLILCVYTVSHLVMLLELPAIGNATGKSMLLYVILITEANDVLQYTWGKIFGKRRILPRISPGKSWEGMLGGLGSTILVGAFLHFLIPVSGIWVWAIPAMLALFGFFGDATISVWKRTAGIKDSGDLIPGHGGMLDRIDSLIFTAPLFYFLMFTLS